MRHGVVLAIWTALSRVFGLAREMVVAALLGTSRWADIWNFSFMLPNMFRRFFAEGALSSALVPILADVHSDQEKEKSFTRAFFTLVLIGSAIFCLLFTFFMPILIPILQNLTRSTSQDMLEVVAPTQALFPFLFLISLAAVCQGVLNVHDRFALPAATPILLNICIIGGGLMLGTRLGHPIWGLVAGVLFGGFLQFIVQWIALWRMGIRITPTLSFWTPKTKEAIKLWLPMTFGAGVYQVNLLLSQSIAFSLSSSSLSALNYSNRLIELVLGVFATALSTSLLPHLSKVRSDGPRFSKDLFQTLEMMALITLPASLGFLVAGYPTISLLFKRGAFNSSSLDWTYYALMMHALALLPLAWYRIMSQALFALKQAKIVMRLSILSTIINVSLCYSLPAFFPDHAKHAGIALATVIYSWVLVVCTLFLLAKKWQIQAHKSFAKECLKILLCAPTVVIPWWNVWHLEHHLGSYILRMGGSIALFLFALILVRCGTLISVFNQFRRRFSKSG